jgi:glycosyltransferase involved in cell wall biosynthesis
MWEIVPRPFRRIAQVATIPLEHQLRGALAKATAVTSHVGSFIEWARRKTPNAPGANDRVFPLGYEVLGDSGDAVDARAFWLGHGLDLDRDEFLVAYVGTISRQCEFSHVVEAARALESDGVRFVLCGSGDLLPELQDAAAASPNMVVPGWCTHAQIAALLSKTGAGLMPYKRLPNFFAAVPNKSFEYMACGVPIVWSLESGALAELIHAEKIGVTYDLTAPGLVAAIRQVREGKAGTIGAAERAQRLFAERFQADRIYDEMARFIESLATR